MSNDTTVKRIYLPSELLRYDNHPLSNVRPWCQCGGQVCAPAYPGDYFDCMKCGKSWPPTKNQIKKMQRGK